MSRVSKYLLKMYGRQPKPASLIAFLIRSLIFVVLMCRPARLGWKGVITGDSGVSFSPRIIRHLRYWTRYSVPCSGRKVTYWLPVLESVLLTMTFVGQLVKLDVILPHD